MRSGLRLTSQLFAQKPVQGVPCESRRLDPHAIKATSREVEAAADVALRRRETMYDGEMPDWPAMTANSLKDETRTEAPRERIVKDESKLMLVRGIAPVPLPGLEGEAGDGVEGEAGAVPVPVAEP